MGESGIVMEMSTGMILYEKNMHDTHYPASITKIMTALLAIENCEMDKVVTVPLEAVYMEDRLYLNKYLYHATYNYNRSSCHFSYIFHLWLLSFLKYIYFLIFPLGIYF